jgi:hypothetical protein
VSCLLVYHFGASPNPSLSLMSDKFRIAGSAPESWFTPIQCFLVPLTPIVPHDID